MKAFEISHTINIFKLFKNKCSFKNTSSTFMKHGSKLAFGPCYFEVMLTSSDLVRRYPRVSPRDLVVNAFLFNTNLYQKINYEIVNH